TPPLEFWTPWADIVHSVELDYRVATGKPWVVTIHDIGPLTHPKFFRKSHPWLLKRALKSALERAAAIICVSRATAEAVEDYTKCRLGDRLTVIPEGVSEEFFAEPTDIVGTLSHRRMPEAQSCSPVVQWSDSPSAPYFLWAGSVNPRKD